jgi:hypothetical protein
MCIICIDFERGKLKPAEARRALGEMRTGLDPSHVEDMEAWLDEAEAEATPGTTP